MKTLMLVLSRGGQLRILVESGALAGLSEHFHIVALTPPSPEQAQYAPLAPEIEFAVLETAKPRFIRRLLQELQKGVIFNDTVKAIARYTIASPRDPSRVLYLPRRFILPLLRYVPGAKPCIRFLARALDPQREHDVLFARHRPDLVFSLSPHDESDAAVLKSAKRFGVRTVAMPKGWDNLPKILFPVKTDHLLVWSPHMRDEAVRYQGYRPQEITITGAPQFDYYVHREHLMSKEDFATRHGLDPRMRIILFGSSGADMCDEARFLDLLAEYLKVHGEYQVLIRPHAGYRRDAERYSRFADEPGFAIDRTIIQAQTSRSAWDTNPERQTNLFNSLAHADVCVTVGSTLIIDATLCGTPVISPNFDVDPGVDPLRRSVKRLFETSYIKDIMKCGATWLVTSKEEFVAALDETLSDRNARLTKREALVRQFVYANDGRAAARVVDAIASL